MNAKDTTLPTLFVPHGAPTFILHPGAAGAAMTQVAASLPRPRAVVVVSAHWDTPRPSVGFANRPETLHDFWGFADELYSIRYAATGCQEAATEVQSALHDVGILAEADQDRGLDHGAWIPLMLMFPDADVPVIPLSIQAPAQRAHPTDEHLLPLYVALGAAGEGFSVSRLHAGVDDYVIAMDAFLFSPSIGV